MGRQGRGRPPHPDILTPREWEVLALLREGLTNEQIAERLDVTVYAAKYHVSEILSKLGVATRDEAALWQPERRRAWQRLLLAGVLLKAAGAAVVLATAVGLGVLAWGVLETSGGDEDAAPGPAIGQGPSPAIHLPEDFLEFVGRLERALAEGSIDFFGKSTMYAEWDCSDSFFPAGGPNCVQASPGTGVPAVLIGAYASEGEVYDALSYGRFLADWRRGIDETASDEFGPPFPRVYALADMLPEVGGEEPGEDTYAVIATRIAPDNPQIRGEIRREVLVFFVASRPEGWTITSLQRAPRHFLDPYGVEAVELEIDKLFKLWVRWDDVRGRTEPLSSARPETGWEGNPRASRRIAYADAQMRLWTGSADGFDRRLIAERPCPSGGEIKQQSLEWSPDGQMVSVICTNERGVEPSRATHSLAVYRLDGVRLTAVDGVNTYRWSPESRRIAYQTTEILGSNPEARVRVFDVVSQVDRPVHDSAILLEWPRDDRLLLGLNPQHTDSDIFVFPRYEAAWFDVETGETERVPRLDNRAQFWMATGGQKAVVLSGQAQRKAGGANLAVFDFRTGEETSLHAAIGYPSEGIPKWMLAVSSAADRIFWGDFGDSGIAIYTATLDGVARTLLARIPGTVLDVSGDGLVLYTPFENPGELRGLDALTGAETSISDRSLGALGPFPTP